MDFARRDKAGDRAVDVHLDPADLVLARSPVTENRVAMPVDQTGCDGTSCGVNRAIRITRVKARDDAIFDQKRVAVGDRGVQISGQKQTDISD